MLTTCSAVILISSSKIWITRGELEIYSKVDNIVNKASVDITVCYGETAAELMKTADLKSKFVIKLNTRQDLQTGLQSLVVADRGNDGVRLQGFIESLFQSDPPFFRESCFLSNI